MALKTKGKILASLIVTAVSFGLITLVRNVDEIDVESIGFNKWNINATVNDDGSMKIDEELHFFNDSDTVRVCESKFKFSKKGSSTVIGSSDESYLRDGSFTCSVIVNGTTKLDEASEVITINNMTNGIAYGNTWANETYFDERGHALRKEGDFDKTFIYIPSGLPSRGLVIKYSYIIENAVSKYSDYSILNWKFAGAYDEALTKNVTVTVNFPSEASAFKDDISNEQFLENGMTSIGFGTNNASYTKLSSTQIICEATKLKYSSRDEIEILTTFNNSVCDIFPNVRSSSSTSLSGKEKITSIIDKALQEEQEYYNKHNTSQICLYVFGGLCIASLLALIIYSYNKFDKERIPLFQDEYYRELPGTYGPAAMVYLYKEQTITKDALNAQIMDLIRKKYITIDTNGSLLTDTNPNYIMIREEKNEEGLLESEKYLLKWLFDIMAKGSNKISFNEMDAYMKNASNAQKYNECNNKWNTLTIKEGSRFNWFDKITSPKAYVSLCIAGIVAAIIGCGFISAYHLSILSILIASIILGLSIFGILYFPTIKRKSKEGIEEYSKWKAFNKFLQEFSQFEDYPIPSLIVWEEYMVYATAFGIADLVEKQLRMKYKEMHKEAEFEMYPFFYYHTYHHVSYRMRMNQTIGMQTIAQAKAAEMSKSSGRSGGFGGGSSFGGGGRGGSFR